MSNSPRPRRSRRLLAPAVAGLLILAASVVPSRADDPAPAGGPIPSDPVFTAQRLDGTTTEGRIRRFGPAGEVVLAPAARADVTIPLRQLLKMTRDPGSFNAAPEGALVLFPGGDQLARAVISAADERSLEVMSESLGNLSIPLDSILGLILNPPTDPDALDALVDRVRREPRSSEVLWLGNGDRVAGAFRGLDEKRIRFQAEATPAELDRPDVLAIGFDPALIAYPAPAKAFVELALTDGTRMGVQALRLERGHLIATTRFGAEVRVAIGEVAALHARTPAVAYLSERDESAKQYVGYVGPARPYRRDLMVEGHPFRLSGRAFDRGLGTQSRTLLAYRLGPGDRRFQALIGVDDRAGPLGSVVFRVLVDGKERFVSPALSVRDQPQAVDVDVSGGKVLILATEFGERGDVRDYADWIEARLIR